MLVGLLTEDIMADTPVDPTPKKPAEKTASGIGKFVQDHKGAVIVGVIILVVMGYFLLKNTNQNTGNSGTGTATQFPKVGMGAGQRGPTGPRGPKGPPGPKGPGGGPPPKKHHGGDGGGDNATINASAFIPMPVNSTHRQASPPIHPFSQQPAVSLN